MTLGQFFFGGLYQKSATISMCKIPLKNVGGVGFLVNDTLTKWCFEILIFWSIFGDRMANLGLIDCKIGLYIKVNVNVRQNKFEVHIYQVAQYGHQFAQNRPVAT